MQTPGSPAFEHAEPTRVDLAYERTPRRVLYGALGVLCVFLTRPARAEPVGPILPRSTVSQTPLDAWQSNIIVDRFLAAHRRQKEEEELKHAFQLSLALGGMMSGGNSRFVGASSDGQFRARRDEDQLTARVAGNYSRTALRGKEAETTVENIQAKTRYDRFFLEDWVAFAGIQGRHDRFQGLDLRLQFVPGVGYYLLNQSDERIWVEGGYEFLYDVRANDAIIARDALNNPVLDAAGNPERLEKVRTLHSVRLFVGYSTEWSDAVTFSADAEYIRAFASFAAYRVNGVASVRAKIKNKWSIASTFTLSYENQPLPDKEPLDTVTSINAVYSFF